jgi:CRISPR-associated endonuclease Cas1 subtype II
MSWRTIVVSNTAKLDYQLGFMVIRGEETVKIHINEIEMLIVESTAVSFTAYLMNELTKNKVKVIFCDEKRNPSSELLPYYGAHDTSAKIRHQMEWTKENKAAIWTEIVTEKIRKQAEHLQDQSKTEAVLLYQYIEEMAFGDETNREGHAAKVYFNALF